MMLAAPKVKATTRIDLLLVEKARDDFESLDKVADEYRARGISIDSHHGDCGPKATTDDDTISQWRYRDITRVDVGGRYEAALFEAAGPPPIR